MPLFSCIESPCRFRGLLQLLPPKIQILHRHLEALLFLLFAAPTATTNQRGANRKKDKTTQTFASCWFRLLTPHWPKAEHPPQIDEAQCPPLVVSCGSCCWRLLTSFSPMYCNFLFMYLFIFNYGLSPSPRAPRLLTAAAQFQ